MTSTLVVAAASVGQSLAIFAFLILTLRLIGRHVMAQLTLIGFLVVALLGSAVESSMYAGSGSLVAGLTAATTILVADKLLSVLSQRSERLRGFLVGSPLVLVHDGQTVPEHLRRSRLTYHDLMTAIRLRGYDKLDDLKYVVLEVDGSVSVIKED